MNSLLKRLASDMAHDRGFKFMVEYSTPWHVSRTLNPIITDFNYVTFGALLSQIVCLSVVCRNSRIIVIGGRHCNGFIGLPPWQPVSALIVCIILLFVF